MLRLFLVVIVFIHCEAVPTGGAGLGYGGSFAPLMGGGLSTAFTSTPIGGGFAGYPLASNFGYGLGYGAGLGGLRAAPIVAPVGLGAPLVGGPILPVGPEVIEVNGDDQPVQVIFRSQGTRVFVQQLHTPGGPGEVETTRSEEDPHRVIHEVVRPVIQEVREIIQPYRRVTQEIRPVLEEVHTVVAKGEGRLNGGLVGGLDGGGYVGGGGLVNGGLVGHGHGGGLALGGVGYKSKKA